MKILKLIYQDYLNQFKISWQIDQNNNTVPPAKQINYLNKQNNQLFCS